MNKILEIKNLSKTFHTINGEVEVLNNISFDVNNNEFVCVVGPSGCGKSTLLNIVADLDSKSSGNFKFNVDEPKIGYMLQNDALFPWLTILENACLGLDVMKIKTKDNIEYTKFLLKKYGLEDFLDKYPKQLSGGMKQRVALIRTLAVKPDILLLDEPFSALDYQTRLEVTNDVHKIIKDENKTALMITHDINEAVSLSDKVIVLTKRPGKIKSIIDINLENKTTPIKNRNDINFNKYYELIWNSIEKNG